MTIEKGHAITVVTLARSSARISKHPWASLAAFDHVMNFINADQVLLGGCFIRFSASVLDAAKRGDRRTANVGSRHCSIDSPSRRLIHDLPGMTRDVSRRSVLDDAPP
jgi:hypothetical protein